MKKTLNPFENAKRIANGAGGVTPAIIEEMQEEITILGSQNTQQAQDITDIKAQLTELAGAYSITEHKTGRKWIDGKNIYEISYDYAITSSGTSVATGLIVPDFDNIVNFFGTVNNGASINYSTEINVILDTDRQIKLNAPAWAIGSHMLITYQYTKPTT